MKTKAAQMVNQAAGAIVITLVFFVLHLSSLYSYLLFHSLVEMFSIVVGFSIFTLTWNSRRFFQNSYLVFIGIAYFFIASLDLAHTLAYKGMGVFPSFDADLPTQLWIAARYLQSLTFLIAPIWLFRRTRLVAVIAAYATIVGVVLLATFQWNLFPTMFVEGAGLTQVKIISEYIICLILLASTLLLARFRSFFDPLVLRWLIFSLLAGIGSELAFTEYISVYGLANQFGHYLKIISFFGVYKAIVETGLIKPYNLLFLDLKKTEEALRVANEDLEARVLERTSALSQANAKLLAQITERERVEAELRLYRDHLEELVNERTQELQLEIVRRSQIEQALLESQERFELAADAANMGTWFWDRLKDELTWSKECRVLFGLAPDAPVTYPLFQQAIHPEDREATSQAIERALAEHSELNVEYRIIWPDGSVHWILTRGRGFQDAFLHPVRIIGIAMDITERKQTEEQIRQNIARAQTLAEISRLLTKSSLDDQSVVDQAADHISRALGDLCAIRAVMVDNQWLKVLAVHHPDPLAAAFMKEKMENSPQRIDEGPTGQVISKGQPLFIADVNLEELKRTAKSEYLGWVERYGLYSLMLVPLIAHGQVIGTLTLLRDRPGQPYTPTDLGFAQECAERTAITIVNARLFRQAQTELELRKRADAALKNYAQQLARSNRELQDFASIASHDLQEPLRKVRTFGDRLMNRFGASLGDEGRDYLNRMQNASSRMQVMLDDLLAYSRVTTKAQPLTPIDLKQIAAEVLSDLEIRIEETGGQVVLGSLPVIEADPSQMRQLFQNLIGNGLKFHSPETPPLVQVYSEIIDLHDQAENQDVLITFADNGIGFEETHLERIFQPFQRLHGRIEYEGTGMGLAICRKIVERHNGQVTAQSKPGEGARFLVRLPRSQRPA